MSITVLDTNDHGPVFSQQRYHFNVPENDDSNITGIVVGKVSANDDDPGENGRVTYNITSSDGQGLFTIDQVFLSIFCLSYDVVSESEITP